MKTILVVLNVDVVNAVVVVVDNKRRIEMIDNEKYETELAIQTLKELIEKERNKINLNYKLIAYQIEADDGLHWVAEFPALKGVVGTAPTVMEGIVDLQSNAYYHIEAMKELGMKIPAEDALEGFDF